MSDALDKAGVDRLAPPRTSSHPSPRTLEALAFADSTPEHSEESAHVQSCARCRAEVEDLRAGRLAFLVRQPPEAFMARLEAAQRPSWTERLRRWMRPGPALGAFAVAAGLLIALRVVPTEDGSSGVKLRGDSSLELHVSRGGPAAPFDGAPLTSGDVVRFVVDAKRAGYAFVVNLDDRGQVTVYVPASGDRGVVVEAGEDRVLPGSIALDDFVGQERIFLFFSARPLAREQVVPALEAAFRGARGRLAAVERIAVEAEISSVTIVKDRGRGAK